LTPEDLVNFAEEVTGKPCEKTMLLLAPRTCSTGNTTPRRSVDGWQEDGQGRLEAWIKHLDNLLIAFSVVVAVGIIGELIDYPHSGVLVAIGVTLEAILG
jgi:hypothetical protein